MIPKSGQVGGDVLSNTFPRVKKIIIEQLGVTEEEVVPTASFVEDLKADSLDLVEIIMDIEREFGLEDIDDATAAKIKTVQDAVDYIQEHSKPRRNRQHVS